MDDDSFAILTKKICEKIIDKKFVSRAYNNPCGFYHLNNDYIFDIDSEQIELLAESEDFFDYFEFEQKLGNDEYKPSLSMQLENYIGLLTLILKEVKKEEKQSIS